MSNSVESLYKDHHEWLRRWLNTRLKQDAIAADLAQDTFIKIIQHYDRYNYDQPRALLTTIAKNLANKWWHRKQIEQAYQESLALIDEQYYPSPEQELIVIQSLIELTEIFNALDARAQKTFILWKVEGLRYQDIAHELDVSIITVKRDIKKILLKCLHVFETES